MPHHPYLIVGGGMAVAAAIQGIREVDVAGTIGLIGGELGAWLDRVANGKEPFRWEQADVARRLIAEPGPFQPADLRRRLPV
jgi:hypothetical protein